MKFWELDRQTYTKYLNTIAKYGMLNDDLFNLLDVYTLKKVEDYKIMSHVGEYVEAHPEAEITIGRVIKEILDHKVDKVPEGSVQANFAQRVVKDLSWCVKFLITARAYREGKK